MLLTVVKLDVDWKYGSLNRAITQEDVSLDDLETVVKIGRTLTDAFGAEAHVQIALRENDIRVIDKNVVQVKEALEAAGINQGYELINIGEEEQGPQFERF